jgi:hypothetical protein
LGEAEIRKPRLNSGKELSASGGLVGIHGQSVYREGNAVGECLGSRKRGESKICRWRTKDTVTDLWLYQVLWLFRMRIF